MSNGVILDDYFYWEGGDFVQVFALTREQEVILVLQYKHGVRDIILDLPAGMIDGSMLSCMGKKRVWYPELKLSLP